ncbi:MAG: hypothetical protein H7330_02565 [Hymenobacteraceae bacterium]|nr:hypothetical protein [Hymenobacteraceae bacterium]
MSHGRTAATRGGNRLPWQGPGTYAPLQTPGWHLIGRGALSEAARAWAAGHGLPATAATATGTEVYLVRPDGYVGLAAARFEAPVFDDYAARWIV